MSIAPVHSAAPLAPLVGTSSLPAGGDSGLPFGDVLRDLVQSTSQRQAQVGDELQRVLTGEAGGVHDLVTSVAEADLAFRLTLEVRDRLISAYQEVMRMQV